MRAALFSQARSLFRRIPASVLKWRPFGVYAITVDELAGQGRGEAEAEDRGNDSTRSVHAESSLVIRWAGPTDRPSLSELSPPELLDLLSRPKQAIIAERDGQVIGAAWFARGKFVEPDIGIEIRLREDDVWLYAAVVHPDHRRQGIYTQILNGALTELAQDQVQRILLGISSGNIASVKSHDKFNAQKIGTVIAGRVGSYLVFAATGGKIEATARTAWGKAAKIRLRISGE